jgi:phosphoribosylanthranilate isomerase
LSRTRIKFCGIRSAKDAQAAVALGVDAIGFVLVPGSPRALTAEKAASIRRRLPPFVSAVALFKDADSAAVQDAIDALCPDLLQFHGNEDEAYCASFGLSYLKAVAMGEGGTFKAEARRHRAASGLLLDSHVRGGMGGRGETFDWRAAQARAWRRCGRLPLMFPVASRRDPASRTTTRCAPLWLRSGAPTRN